jgi:hypothetical protein
MQTFAFNLICSYCCNSFCRMQFLTVVNCSSIKTVSVDSSLRARVLRRGNVDDVAQQWCGRVSLSMHRTAAGELYGGRSFCLAAEATRRVSGQLAIVSAGMGIVGPERRIPPYSLTITAGARDCVLDRADRRHLFSPEEWWRAIRRQRQGAAKIRTLFRRHPSALVVFALTGPYLRMVAEEISEVDENDLQRLRIVGPTTSQLPGFLRESIMPYDARLNDPSLKIRGTQFDFPARALSHFLELLRSDSRLSSAAAHGRRVRQAIARWRAPERVTRTRIDDETLQRRIRTLQRSKISQAAALAHLRGTLGLACEATRFAATWRQVQVLNRG